MAYFRLWTGYGELYKNEFYYMHLDRKEQNLYEEILAAVLKLETTVKVSANIAAERLSYIYCCVLWDNPHICYVSSYSAVIGTGTLSKSLRFDYLFPLCQCKSMQNEFQEKVEQIVQRLDLDGLPDFEKELFLHDYMVENLSYDYEALQKEKRDGKNLAYSVYGAVWHKKAVCQGIAAMFKILADISGIQSILISGGLTGGISHQTTEPHLWNLVCIEGKYAHLDVTNDLDTKNRKRGYSKFNFTDKQAIKTYSWEDRGYPKCESKQYYYYEYLKMTVHSVEELRTFVRRRKEKRDFQICFGEGFLESEEKILDYAGQIVLQEFAKYLNNVKIKFEWVPEARIMHVWRT